MNETRRIVTLDAAGAVSSILVDLAGYQEFLPARDEWAIKPASRAAQFSQGPGRWSGSWQVGERRDNAQVTGKWMITAATPDAGLEALERIASVVDDVNQPGAFLEWRPEGATASVFFELRGAAEWTPSYSWQQFVSYHSMLVEATFPVAPLARAEPFIATTTGAANATVWQLPSIPGTAPALLDLQVDAPSLSAALPWALVAWAPRVTGAPFGGIAANTGGDLAVWTSQTQHSTAGLWDTAVSGAKTYRASYAIRPDKLPPDEFHHGHVTLEVWAHAWLHSTITGLSARAWVAPTDGVGAARYCQPAGSIGRAIVLPTGSGGAFKLLRLGEVALPTDSARAYKLWVEFATATSSTGELGLANVLFTRSVARAAGLTGVPYDNAYAPFIATTGAALTRTVKSDLRGYQCLDGGVPARDNAGLAGAPLEVPPGNNDLFVRMAQVVPDDPAPTTATSATSVSGFDLAATITPRFRLVAGGALP